MSTDQDFLIHFSLETYERKFRSQRSVESLVGDEEYIVCYSCLWAQNIETEEIYIDEGNCNSDSAVYENTFLNEIQIFDIICSVDHI